MPKIELTPEVTRNNLRAWGSLLDTVLRGRTVHVTCNEDDSRHRSRDPQAIEHFVVTAVQMVGDNQVAIDIAGGGEHANHRIYPGCVITMNGRTMRIERPRTMNTGDTLTITVD